MFVFLSLSVRYVFWMFFRHGTVQAQTTGRRSPTCCATARRSRTASMRRIPTRRRPGASGRSSTLLWRRRSRATEQEGHGRGGRRVRTPPRRVQRRPRRPNSKAPPPDMNARMRERLVNESLCFILKIHQFEMVIHTQTQTIHKTVKEPNRQ